ncbi:MAG: hypothetical protein IJV43_01440 [Oscillospiraceae bacterium]|nr:hypothetical protein [Oscillospiraceae bacterium]
MAKAKAKKPIYKRWWVWVVGLLLIFGAISTGGRNDEEKVSDTTSAFDTALETPARTIETPDEKGQRLADEAAAEDAREQAALAEAQKIAATQDDAPEPSAPAERSTPIVQSEPELEPQPEPVADPEPELEPVSEPVPTPEPEPDITPPPAPAKITAVVHGTDRLVSLEQGTLVWLSATGSKFHNKNNCGTMNPDKARQVTVDYATSRGFDACEKCY